MPYNHEDVIQAQFNKLTAERARAVGEYEEARIGEYADAVMYAADRITEIDAKIGALNQIANNLWPGNSASSPRTNTGSTRTSRKSHAASPRATAPCRTMIANGSIPSKSLGIGACARAANTGTIKDRYADEPYIQVDHFRDGADRRSRCRRL